MQVTRAVDYGIRALIVMSRQPVGSRFFLQELADKADLPRNYLVKVLKCLSGCAIVRSHRGIKGGFSLSRDPKDINLRQVVEAIDGPITIMHCLTDKQSCSYVGCCAAEVFFVELRQQVLLVMEKKTLHDLITLQNTIDSNDCKCPGAQKTVAEKATAYPR